MIKVMIVEDDPMVREINSRFLEKVDGFTLAKAASNLKEAKEFVSKNKIDLILLDVYLPKESGLDFLKWLRKEEKIIDIILITADKSRESVQEAFRFGAVDYLIKPFSFERFKEALFLFKERYDRFKKNETIEQEELDKLIISSKNTADVKKGNTDLLEKGFNKYTYTSIWDAIEKKGDEYFVAEDLAEQLGIARVTVRKYLEYMDKEGRLTKLIEYGKVGRPQHRYRIVDTTLSP
ncbi:transcriptional regulatory protein [Clostridium polyendosporum]|uniref:Transcriptional regulatory protein n=1 Tax=Clostridium polyendosporum TaxID=69208 RepID=A0A919RZ70_9CLOT|nr:response regulator [Clostridium polyendosporum]GIM27683.1 transcriptional regulatory protein [Clostridium polyendosporum]